MEDDDDDVIMLPNEEPLITEIVDDDDDEYIPTSVTREEMGNVANDSQDGIQIEPDVEIQEPHIPFTDLDQYEEGDNQQKTHEEAKTDEKEHTNSNNSDKMDAIDDQNDFRNIKIKTEPTDELEDEDDGFEDVGTVLITPEELSIGSSGGKFILLLYLIKQ